MRMILISLLSIFPQPWTVEYTNSNLPEKILSISLGSVNSEVIVDQAGTYRILKVSDVSFTSCHPRATD